MATVPPRTERRRARPGSLDRPVNGRLYRGTWLLVGVPLLVLAFSVARPPGLPPPHPPPPVAPTPPPGPPPSPATTQRVSPPGARSATRAGSRGLPPPPAPPAGSH